jgi:release factor glutamine methyltransferase
MTEIQDIINKYKNEVDHFDLELLIANSLGKPREFVLSYPENPLTSKQEVAINKNVKRRINGEPIAYILGHKEFYGLDFKVNKYTLIPRPETEFLVETALNLLKARKASVVQKATVVDVGTGSGNIIVSIAKTAEKSELRISNAEFFGIDISKEALKVAKSNAAVHHLDQKVNFINGSLLAPLLKNKELEASDLIIIANLPYLSKEIYQSAPIDVKKFEPKTALYSPEQGLQHYRKLLEQLKDLPSTNHQLKFSLLLEISPEQKQLLPEVVKPIFPKAKISFQKDLAAKWRVCKIII